MPMASSDTDSCAVWPFDDFLVVAYVIHTLLLVAPGSLVVFVRLESFVTCVLLGSPVAFGSLLPWCSIDPTEVPWFGSFVPQVGSWCFLA